MGSRRSREAVESAIRSASDLALDFLEQERESSVPAPRDPEELYAELGIALGEDGCTWGELVIKLRRVLAATPSSASRRFYNQLFGGRDPAAFAAEMLTPLTNTSMYTYKVAGPQILIERELVSRMAEKVGYAEGQGIFTPGGSLSNFTAMIIARNETVPAARDEGLGDARLTIYSSVDGHYSIRKNAGFIGVGRQNVRDVPTDSRGRMDLTELRRMIETDRERGCTPMMINATAGTTVLGAFDPIREIAGVAREQRIWLHVDGAFGGSALMSDEHRHLLDGSHLADSFTWDAHKMLGAPLICSVILLKHGGLLAKHTSEQADYLFQGDTDELNPGTRSIQCGRRNDALKLWAAWQHHGDSGYARRTDRQFALARQAAERIESDPDLRLVKDPESICVCFEVQGRSTRTICERLDREGRLKVGYGTVDGRPAIRLVTVNPDLTEEDLAVFFDEIKVVAAQLSPDCP